jgi:hypothetical protein
MIEEVSKRYVRMAHAVVSSAWKVPSWVAIIISTP